MQASLPSQLGHATAGQHTAAAFALLQDTPPAQAIFPAAGRSTNPVDALLQPQQCQGLMLQAVVPAQSSFPAAGQATNPALAGSELPSQQPAGELGTGAGIKVEPVSLALWNLDRIDQRELPLNREYRRGPLH